MNEEEFIGKFSEGKKNIVVICDRRFIADDFMLFENLFRFSDGVYGWDHVSLYLGDEHIWTGPMECVEDVYPLHTENTEGEE